MQSNTFTGNLAKTPSQTGQGDSAVTRFTLLSNEYAGKNKETGESKERTVGLQFSAFGAKADLIAKNFDKGDQMVVSFRIENNNYKASGKDVYDYNFIVLDLEFGARGKVSREKAAASE